MFFQIRLSHIFSSDDQQNVIEALKNQAPKFYQFRRAFLFVCDHVGIRDGIRMWTEQLANVMYSSLAMKVARHNEVRIFT